MTKTCTECSCAKPLSEFNVKKTGAHGRDAKCRACRKISRRIYYAANKSEISAQVAAYRSTRKDWWAKYRAKWGKENKERRSALARHSWLRRKYGITHEEYEAMRAKQDGRCAICGREEKSARGVGRLYVDHDHATDKIRGLLCFGCNAALGHFEESSASLLAAERYLQFHRSSAPGPRDSPRESSGADGHFLKAV